MQERSVIKTFLLLAVFVVVGVPFVAYLWESLNMAMSWQISGPRALVSLGVFAVFAVLITVFARKLRHW